MSASKRRAAAVARGEPDPGSDRVTRRVVRVRERDGRFFVRIFGQDQELRGEGPIRDGDRIVVDVGIARAR